ncbi:PolC-type DNA polymerase III N-terminal domain-containing protein [Paenibacillus larvae]|nr:PolC-type DNA polymerase III N-terminal domain-containing protein [Paenibacillus larvae]MDT2254530.1 PolC-type DNA polymerase III N-terminal domain-containing protein [Paenibacillus larvae]
MECSRTNREWTFYLLKSTIVPQEAYRNFCKRIQEKFQHIAKIRFKLHMQEAQPAEVVEQFWSLFIEWVQREAVSVNGWLSRAKVEVRIIY